MSGYESKNHSLAREYRHWVSSYEDDIISIMQANHLQDIESVSHDVNFRNIGKAKYTSFTAIKPFLN